MTDIIRIKLGVLITVAGQLIYFTYLYANLDRDVKINSVHIAEVRAEQARRTENVYLVKQLTKDVVELRSRVRQAEIRIIQNGEGSN